MARMFRSLVKLFFLFQLTLGHIWLLAQTDSLVEIKATPSDRRILEKYDFERSFSAPEIVRALHNDGYLLARVDSISSARGHTILIFSIGQQYHWAYLGPGNVDDQMLRKIGFRERLYRAKPFRYREINTLMDHILEYSGNNGYPFAEVRLDSIGLSGPTMRASLNYQSGPYITFDSIEIAGSAKVKHKFLFQHVQIFPGKPFSEQRVAAVGRELNSLEFIQQMQPPPAILPKF